MAGLAGKLMRVQKGATNFKVEKCRSNLRTQLVETTNSESGPGGGIVAEEFVFGVQGTDIDIDVVYQISDGVYAALADGGAYAVTFYPDKGTTGSTLAGTLMVEQFEFAGEVKGKMSARITGKFTGGRTVTSL